MIIKRLEEEGIFSMNKEMEFPVVPQRIAIISSKNAAGYSDFIRHLKENSYGYIFYTALFETVMQGPETERSVIDALDRIADNPYMFDLVAIIRGGGSQTDLSWFDNYNIAYHVTQFPLPVITGIGHEKDLSVTDMVAFQALKTPTAVADHLIDCIAEAENHLNEIISGIAENSRLIIEEYKNLTESFRLKLMPVAKLMISNQKGKLSNRIIETINFGKDYILKAALCPANQKSRLISLTGIYSQGKKSLIEKKRLDLISFTLNTLEQKKIKTDGLGNSLNILDPVNVLKRGYTITMSDKRIIKSAHLVSCDDIIDTLFGDGKIRSRVVKKKVEGG
jgi:exodeoxyribonuclease VII large subunit